MVFVTVLRCIVNVCCFLVDIDCVIYVFCFVFDVLFFICCLYGGILYFMRSRLMY